MSKTKSLPTVTQIDNNMTDFVVDALVDHATLAAAIAEPEEFVDQFGERTFARQLPKFKQKPTCQQQTANCLKRTCVFMLSYLGLTSMVVAYSILGGFLFEYLEGPNERFVQDTLRDQTETLREDFEKKICQLNLSICNNTTELSTLILNFSVGTHKLISTYGWAGSDGEFGEKHRWTLAGALLYAVTVITTIGFGTYTPKTIEGQAVTIAYALIGIPLTVLCISNIGIGMANLVRALYGGTFCVECRQQFLYSVQKAKRRDSKNAEEIELDKIDDELEQISQCEVNHKLTEVPVWISLFLAMWYVFFGATLFTIWESHWNLFTGTYFCFVTLSTIGFGDIVPGMSNEDWNDEVKQVACSLYLLVGLATLAMCFDLIQQRCKKWANKFGYFIGLVN